MNPDTLPRTDPATNPPPQFPYGQQAASTPVADQSSPYQEVKDAAGEQIRQVSADFKESGREALQTAKEAGSNFLHEQQEKVAEHIDRYTDAVRAACESFKSTEGNPLVAPAQRATRQMEKATEYLRNHDASEFLNDLGAFARRKPEIVFGGLFVAGLASVRFLKASAIDRRRDGSSALSRPSTPRPTSYQPASAMTVSSLSRQPILNPDQLK